MHHASAASLSALKASGIDAGREDVQQGLKDFPQPHVVTEDDVSAGRYSIMEVVLPQPGRYMTYPTHDAAQVRLAAAGKHPASCLHPLTSTL